jgi:hypothetical protein
MANYKNCRHKKTAMLSCAGNALSKLVTKPVLSFESGAMLNPHGLFCKVFIFAIPI